MGQIVWNENLSVGVKKFDEQHKKLIEIINTFQEAMSNGKEKLIMYKVFEDLVNYTLYHFASEEDTFDIYKFPNSAKHIREHMELTLKVREYDDRFKGGQFISSIDLMNFLKLWFLKHILDTDKELGKYLNSKGLK